MNEAFYISHLFIYPIKGLPGITLKASFVTTRGLEYDRRWMLIDEQNQFISQRAFPNLCLFKIEMVEEGFLVTYNANSTLVPFEIIDGEKVQVKIWDDEVAAFSAHESINDFFSQQLKIKCSLVFMPNESNRWIDKNFVKEDVPVSFADGYPVLLIGQESLNFLNSKLDETIEMDRFRPNIVFEGGLAHEEDLMVNFSIADVHFKGVKPCGRCQVPGINQQTGIISKEPTRTLASYRNFNSKINFGQNIIVLKEGKICVNDKIILKN
jgi:uncharacterized protein YcbX